ncbi:hypothetical protein LTR56_022570 [Elasticomyces elasticus]|nr:hypothetical protein LTR56_022570 [Elasticomyces elasticus]KAK4923781.1 hypothetical protein LTR49_009138 [Elasticomyces elasticus]KAK5743585.1 hypothetical protein LTS12_023798 [Elasticomyces elasticus]
MAMASKIQLYATQQPEYYRHGIEQAATDKASALLQRNHDRHHIFFNRDGFHDHIAHHVLTLWALRADSSDLQHAYDINAGYQRTLGKLAATDMHSVEKFKSYLGKEQYYHDFMVFFQDEMEKTSMPEVVNNTYAHPTTLLQHRRKDCLEPPGLSTRVKTQNSAALVPRLLRADDNKFPDGNRNIRKSFANPNDLKQRNGHVRKYDFYYMHCVNCSIFLSTLLKLDWITDANKVRLLNWKVWNDLAMYASRKSPEIRMDLVRQYKPKESSGWDGIFDRVTGLEDDGHASKLVRALAHGQQICGAYEDREEFRVKHDDWLLMGHMAIDSVEAGEPHWIRSAGFDEAWESPALRAQL